MRLKIALGSNANHHGPARCEMLDPCKKEDLLSRVAASIFVVVAFQLVSVARAQAPDPADIAAGMRLFRQKGNCQACHGWAGDGRKMDSQMPDGANLRESMLDRETLITIIKCGRPGTGMPAYDKFAYSDGRCYGLKQADLKSPTRQMPDPPATLQVREIEAIADFMFAKIIGKGTMDREKCVDYWGSDVELCSELAK
jgi:mono/diheme cytochrome c family protein